MFIEQFDSPCGTISIIFDEKDVLYHLDFPDQGDRQNRMIEKRFKDIVLEKGQSDHIKSHLLAYMNGDFAALDKIPCDLGGTEFQNRVWQALKEIPVGKTYSYLELAEKIGNKKAVRAVARANALNPVSLIYPCHRVIGSDGSLTGYAGGLDRKDWLLRHEGAI
ncbi:methylated-DNA--[protein]-cysteine S-methyltransferase [Terasakiella sp. A23]|uniref:methylated-DNA--[protein]-cysteine S-methyltransferase n=1 Tax=Terasakiella sp. FCG-A23 TaxID=3080561 RepID=UPI0029544787|nr:methylated-DNA--[protein]-cysteine S-methyltransferase [Terasakiella sp. A23]MDV7341167.1 methylated-DNA--[protein]-cysteine S-methyltransferase [Terasakiella sp. A23]